MTYTVAVYLCDRAYGGPEEGGWWYSTGALVRAVRRFKSEERAIRFAYRMNELLAVTLNKGRRPISSVLSDGRYAAEVCDGEPVSHYPEIVPHYE